VSPVVPSATTTLPAVSRTVRNPFVIALNLNVQTALEADQCNLGEITNDFFSKAWIIYEDEIADSKEQYDCVRVIIGALQVTKSLSEAQYSDLTKKTAQYAAKLLRKPDQSNAVAMCSHLFWNKSTSANENPDTKHVLECLKQSFKIAESCMDTTVNAQLYVDLLNEWLYYFEENPNEQAKKYVNGLIKLVKQTFASSTTNKPEVVTHFDNTLKHIRIKQKTDEHYRAIELD
jgi:vacuolar protein sorting-associated protein 35